ncbi:hypothetical protein GmarT_10970 [Gimesia maris]|uniref:Uncharacterized protein n=1 Tax=Gimesia maris TaxID=122 RepID=A0ABX5YHP8_9PLAN|nr:hypothetical protein Mal35_10950 [Gimesia maris]QDU13330.1 hypothetical protein CA11_11130 [Gimesia maris]QEG15257.1 hypothetical protein GmarT_10970 [Gimesia maris]
MLLAQLKTDHEYRSPEGTAKQTLSSLVHLGSFVASNK